jgi:hypothetical protein
MEKVDDDLNTILQVPVLITGDNGTAYFNARSWVGQSWGLESDASNSVSGEFS